MSVARSHWQLDPDITFLNHGSFGATPTCVLQTQREIRDELESQPIRFLAPERELEPKLDQTRERMAELVGAHSDDLVWVRNATDGVNAVLRSFPLQRADEIVVTNHGYNACNNAAKFAAQRAGATVRIADIPFPISDSEQVVAAVVAAITDRTRLLLVDHVTSATGLILPLTNIVAAAKARGVRVLVDGAHAPGMIPLNLRAIDADYYTGNHHKWLCGPKASAFLWVRSEWQHEVRPTVISHAANRPRPNRSQFIAEFDWVGTFDPTPLLSMPAAIDFLSELLPGGMTTLMNSNRNCALQARRVLTEALGIQPPAPAEMIGALVTLPLPLQASETSTIDALEVQLRDQEQIEVPIFRGFDSAPWLIRTSSQFYNHASDYERLATILTSRFSHA